MTAEPVAIPGITVPVVYTGMPTEGPARIYRLDRRRPPSRVPFAPSDVSVDEALTWALQWATLAAEIGQPLCLGITAAGAITPCVVVGGAA